MRRHTSQVSIKAVVALVVLTLILQGCGPSSGSGEQVYQQIKSGEQVDLASLSCGQLEYLAQKYQSIAQSASQASNNGNSPAADGSAATAVQAYNALARVQSAQANKGC